MSGQLHALVPLTPGKGPPVPIEYEASLTPEPLWTLCNSVHVGNRTSSVQPLAIPTELSQLAILFYYVYNYSIRKDYNLYSY
jgi:hypothetical protein